MTIQEAKDQAAQEFGYNDYKDLEGAEGYLSDNEEIIDRSLEIYAEAKAKEAFEAARGIDYNGTNEYYFADYEDYKTTS